VRKAFCTIPGNRYQEAVCLWLFWGLQEKGGEKQKGRFPALKNLFSRRAGRAGIFPAFSLLYQEENDD